MNVNARGLDSTTALISATQKGHCDVVCEILKHDGLDVNARGRCGNTALIFASLSRHCEVVDAER